MEKKNNRYFQIRFPKKLGKQTKLMIIFRNPYGHHALYISLYYCCFNP